MAAKEKTKAIQKNVPILKQTKSSRISLLKDKTVKLSSKNLALLKNKPVTYPNSK